MAIPFHLIAPFYNSSTPKIIVEYPYQRLAQKKILLLNKLSERLQPLLRFDARLAA